MTKLTREYFETHGYKAGTYTVDGTELWCVSLRKRYEEGDHIYANVDITNSMYPERFAFSGNIGNQCYINTVMLYTVEDLETLYKLSHVKYDEETNDFYRINDIECNKDLIVE